MPQLTMSRREPAGVPVTTAVEGLAEPSPAPRVVALGWISRHGGQVTISDWLAGSTSSGNRMVKA